jgi:hypothetical protein
LLYLGNDIVDLAEPGARGKSNDEAFRDRILADQEKLYWAASPCRDEALWLIWAAKEAAFKVMSKIKVDYPFIPRKLPVGFPVSLRKEQIRGGGQLLAGEASLAEGVIRLSAQITGEYIHVLAFAPAETFSQIISGITRMDPGLSAPPDESQLVRDFAIAHIAGWCLGNPEEIAIKRFPRGKRWGPPRLFYRDEEAKGDLSLSHDGRFIAYAFSG